jgi:hypothetical protein
MTTLLTREQVDTLRSIGDGALVLMAMAMIDRNYAGRITRPDELLSCLYPTYKDRRKLIMQLDSLSASGRLAKNGAGYVLLDGGRALLLGMNPELTEDLALSPVTAQALKTPEAQALKTQMVQVISTEIVENDDARNARALKKEEEESIKLINIESSSSSQKESQNARKAITTQNLLDASDCLFPADQKLAQAGLYLDLISPSYVLGVLAHCCAESAHLKRPSGLAYNMLKSMGPHPKEFKTVHPRHVYVNAPWGYLPNEFKEKFGMAVYPCPFDAECGGIVFGTLTEYESHMQASHSFETVEESQETQPEPIQPTVVNPQALALWQKVLETLKAELPKASFEMWLCSAQVEGVTDYLLTVKAHNSYARDWLSSRLAKRIGELAGRTVEFIA